MGSPCFGSMGASAERPGDETCPKWMRFKARRAAMRRISWADQGINGRSIKGAFGASSVKLFFGAKRHWRARKSRSSNRGHHGEGKRDERHMATPAMSGAGLIVIEAEFAFFAVSKLFLIAQRCPSTLTNFSIDVPLSAHVVKRRGRRPRYCGGSAVRASKRP